MMKKMYMVLLVQLVLGGALELKEEAKCDKVKCPSIPKHYEELGCEPVKTDDDCCPVR